MFPKKSASFAAVRAVLTSGQLSADVALQGNGYAFLDANATNTSKSLATGFVAGTIAEYLILNIVTTILTWNFNSQVTQMSPVVIR